MSGKNPVNSLRLVLLLLLLVSGSSATLASAGLRQTTEPLPEPAPASTSPVHEPEVRISPIATAVSSVPVLKEEQAMSQSASIEESLAMETDNWLYEQQEALPVAEDSSNNVTTLPDWNVAEPLKWAPTQLTISAIDVTAPIVGVGVTADGAMEAPTEYDEVGWLQTGALPGEVGRAVLAGHVDSKTGPAIFYRLRELQPGSIIEVTMGGTGEVLRFEVRETAQYPETEAPLEQVFGTSDKPELVVITCAGSFDRDRGAYDQRLVIYAELQQPDAG